MKKKLETWRFVAERLGNNRVALLVVAESSGSSPGRQGFKMAVTEHSLFGSIGGGLMEVSLVERARKHVNQPFTPIKSAGDSDSSNMAYKTRNAQLIIQEHRANSRYPSGMICSGEQKVILYELDEQDLEAVQSIISALEKGIPAVLEISDFRFQISQPGVSEYIPDFGFDYSNDRFLYRERLGYKNELFIVGGGHCALALSEIMSKMDFRISLFDDRPELNTVDKNAFAHQKTIIDAYEEIGDFIPGGADHFVVVMTIGYKFDKLVIEKLLDKNFKYFGVLGSKAKMAQMLRELKNEGFDLDRLKEIHTPIGLEINSQTPAEIAVSIAAEIVAVKNAKG